MGLFLVVFFAGVICMVVGISRKCTGYDASEQYDLVHRSENPSDYLQDEEVTDQ